MSTTRHNCHNASARQTKICVHSLTVRLVMFCEFQCKILNHATGPQSDVLCLQRVTVKSKLNEIGLRWPHFVARSSLFRILPKTRRFDQHSANTAHFPKQSCVCQSPKFRWILFGKMRGVRAVSVKSKCLGSIRERELCATK